jgi:hypothetical protein
MLSALVPVPALLSHFKHEQMPQERQLAAHTSTRPHLFVVVVIRAEVLLDLHGIGVLLVAYLVAPQWGRQRGVGQESAGCPAECCTQLIHSLQDSCCSCSIL